MSNSGKIPGQNEFDNDTERTVSIRRENVTVDVAYLKEEKEFVFASYDPWGNPLRRLPLTNEEIQALKKLFSSLSFA
jgi:hypothetical protein